MGLSVIAFLINYSLRKVSNGAINMFFIGPSKNPLIILKSIAQMGGWYTATLVYIPAVCLGAWIVYRFTKMFYFLEERKSETTRVRFTKEG